MFNKTTAYPLQKSKRTIYHIENFFPTVLLSHFKSVPFYQYRTIQITICSTPPFWNRFFDNTQEISCQKLYSTNFSFC